MAGFHCHGTGIAFDHGGPRDGGFAGAMREWVRDGTVEAREAIAFGLQNAPKAFIAPLLGKNFGKLVIPFARE